MLPPRWRCATMRDRTTNRPGPWRTQRFFMPWSHWVLWGNNRRFLPLPPPHSQGCRDMIKRQTKCRQAYNSYYYLLISIRACNKFINLLHYLLPATKQTICQSVVVKTLKWMLLIICKIESKFNHNRIPVLLSISINQSIKVINVWSIPDWCSHCRDRPIVIFKLRPKPKGGRK